MSDFEPGIDHYDMTTTRISPDVNQFLTQDERDAIEFADLCAADDGSDTYHYACIYRGLNPQTQEPWTENEIAEFKNSVGFDPRSVPDWLRVDIEIQAAYEQYFKKGE